VYSKKASRCRGQQGEAAKNSYDDKQRLREQYARPHVEEFFAWVEGEKARVAGTRGLLPKALGYATNHKAALMRYLEDGRVVLDNNRSVKGRPR